jgi:hypothetical protein
MGVVRGSIPRESILFAFGYVHPQFHCTAVGVGFLFSIQLMAIISYVGMIYTFLNPSLRSMSIS